MELGLQDVRFRIVERRDNSVVSADLIDHPGESVLIATDLLHAMDLSSSPGFRFTIRGKVTGYEPGEKVYMAASPPPEVTVPKE